MRDAVVSAPRGRLATVLSRVGRWRVVWALGYISGMFSYWAAANRANPLTLVVLAVLASGVLAVLARRASGERP